MVAALAVLTGLPWVTSDLIPDFATALLAIVLALLVIVPDRLGRRECWVLALLATALIAVHLSNLLLAPLLLGVLLPLRRRLGAAAPLGAPGAAARRRAAGGGGAGAVHGEPDRPWPLLALALRQRVRADAQPL